MTPVRPTSRAASKRSSSPLAMRRRGDLQVKACQFQGRTSWVVKDPISLNYFRLTEEEYFVLDLLNGSVSLDELRRAVDERFQPRVVGLNELQSLLYLFRQRGLIVVHAIGQGAQLLEKKRKSGLFRYLTPLANPLAIRLPGIDPEPFLQLAYPLLKWLFRPACLLVSGLLIVSALLLWLVQIETLYARLPSFQQFFAATNIVWLMAAIAFTKILHELAHGLTCKHFGGECHEIGMIFLVFTPALYCDTTDSWMMSNKWHRVAVSAAGIYVELVLASVCTFLWWFSQPGLLHYVCLSTMFVCSVSTLLFNANPLLRYDGYYVLSDWLEIPNLWQRSRAALSGALGSWCLGLPWHSELSLPDRGRITFVLYALASTVYRWIVLLLILWFLSRVLEPYGLQVLGHLAIAIALFSLVSVSAWQLLRFLGTRGRMRQVKIFRLLLSAMVLGMVIWVICHLPLPVFVMAAVVLEPRDATRAYVEVPGVLERTTVAPGQSVAEGELLAELTNPQIPLEILRLESQRDQLQLRLTLLRRRQGQDRAAAEQIPQVQTALTDVQQRLETQQKQAARLTLRSPASGTILSPADMPDIDPEDALPMWSGSPLDERNLGALLEPGTLFCVIGDPHRMEAVVVIDHTDIEYLHVGQPVAIQLNEYSTRQFDGEIEEIAYTDLRYIPKNLSHKAGGHINTVTDDNGQERSLSPTYQARVRLSDSDVRLLPGFRGRARIHVGDGTIVQQIWRNLRKAFLFH